MVCFGGEKISKYEKHLVINNNLSGSIQFITGGSEKLKELYAMSKVFVFSSLYEGFGIPLLESIHSGCLPLCFNIDVFNEIGKDSLIYFHNKEDLIEKLEYILSMNETDYYENLIKLRNTTNSFTLENMVLNTEKVYQSLL